MRSTRRAGFFGVAPGTGVKTNKNAIDTLTANCIYTNTALTDDGDVWWEGMTDTPPAEHDRLAGPALDPSLGQARRASQCALHAPLRNNAPSIADEWADPAACRSRRCCSVDGAATRGAARDRVL